MLFRSAGLPGLSQLGALVGAGILITPFVMLFVFLPIARGLTTRRLVAAIEGSAPTDESVQARRSIWRGILECEIVSARARRALTVALAIAAALCIGVRGVRIDRGNSAIEPGRTEAKEALDEMSLRMMHQSEPLLWVAVGNEIGRAHV